MPGATSLMVDAEGLAGGVVGVHRARRSGERSQSASTRASLARLPTASVVATRR